jgi:hypothetical protein
MKHKDNEIPIYHPHGFLPMEGNPSEYIILSEDMYHDQYGEPYNWNNFIQIDKFTNFNCLFIGVSFTDPNLRRLLDISKDLIGESKVKHFVIRKRYDRSKINEDFKKLLRNSPHLRSEKENAEMGFADTSEKLVKLMENFQQKDAESFNVGTIWVDDYYPDVPELLSRISIE